MMHYIWFTVRKSGTGRAQPVIDVVLVPQSWQEAAKNYHALIITDCHGCF